MAASVWAEASPTYCPDLGDSGMVANFVTMLLICAPGYDLGCRVALRDAGSKPIRIGLQVI
jgi:hypothetical protein